ncbi:HK97 family phage prohead protease [Tistrella bauzanensis]|uniref:HK97 family phage prohead protease n=1 Tax=Tistrella TaxID=171436 RepID=UPI0031F65CB2
MERMCCDLREVKLASDDDDAMTLTGYGSVFGVVDSYGDVVAKGAFKATLAAAKAKGRMPAMLAQHGGAWSASDMMPIGVWTKMVEDNTGLYVEGRLAKTPRGIEAYELLRINALSGLSIGYIPKTWRRSDKPDEPRRTLTAVDLLELSLVTFPANDKSRVASVKSAITTIRDFEAWLRDAGGYSRDEAKAIASHGYKAVTRPRDEGMSTDVAAYAARLRALASGA